MLAYRRSRSGGAWNRLSLSMMEKKCGLLRNPLLYAERAVLKNTLACGNRSARYPAAICHASSALSCPGAANGSSPSSQILDHLKKQGVQANQDITFITDGGDEVRSLDEMIAPASEHVLDWFHITCASRSFASSPRASKTMMGTPGRTCLKRFAGSIGISGTAMRTVPVRKSITCKSMRKLSKRTTRTCASS